MRVRVNGAERELEEGATVATLLEAVGVPRQGTAVVRRGEIVPRSDYEETALEEGDALEVVRMVGGG